MQLGAPANDEFNDTLFFDDVIKSFIYHFIISEPGS